MIPSWKRFSPSLALALTLAGCAGRGAEGPGDVDKERRRPDGVAIDPISAPPPARERAETSDGLVTLRAPLGVDRAVSTVEELFRRIVLEDGEGLERLLAPDALAVTSTGPSVGP